MRSALPAKSPTVVLIWATAIFIGERADAGERLESGKGQL